MSMSYSNEMPLISVIVPIYNTEKYLERCIESIRMQTHQNLQIILVDDGSTDNSLDICEKHAELDERIEIIKKKNGGLSSARNAGLLAARGKYIGFVDSDDIIRDTMYEDLFKSVPVGGISNIGMVYIDKQSEPLWTEPVSSKDDQTGIEFIRELLLYTGDSSVCSKLFPRDLFNEVVFDEGLLNEDFKIMLQIARRITRVRYTDTAGYCYRKRTGSITSGYGKATEDSVRNAIWAKNYINEYYPNLIREASSFALYQHMIYLLTIPRKLANRGNDFYRNAVIYVRKHSMRDGVLNPYFRVIPKLVVFVQSIFPRFPARLYNAWKRIKKGRKE